MGTLIRRLWVSTVVVSVCFQLSWVTVSIAQDIRIHYLGHAGFILRFDNGVGLVTDYAFFHDIGDYKPDIVTYSHGHDDHAGGVLPTDMDMHHVLNNGMALEMEGLSIRPIPTSETSPGSNDNISYLISYKGFNILHMGDAQVDISEIESAEERALLKQILPEKIDLLLMPIGKGGGGGITREEVAAFIDFAHPLRVIPMHYWHFWEKWLFLRYMEHRSKENGNRYDIKKVDSPKYTIDTSVPPKKGVIEIIALDDGDYE